MILIAILAVCFFTMAAIVVIRETRWFRATHKEAKPKPDKTEKEWKL